MRALVLVLMWAPIYVAVFGALQLLELASSIPELPPLVAAPAERSSRVETYDGWRLAGARVRSELAYDELDPMMIGAILAAEDENFFAHDAFSLRGILRAAFQNLQAGAKTQGASTITQQVSRRFLENDDKTYSRKVKELLLARRLEANHSKHDILAVYLAGAYFGERATGLDQASWTYFGRSPNDLTVDQMALLAGLLPAPSVYTPFRNPDLARRERGRVLRRMVDLGLISEERREVLQGRALGIAPDTLAVASRVPQATETAIRALEELTGEESPKDDAPESWKSGGYTVTLTVSPAHRARLETSARAAIMEHDHRQGWRGPVARASSASRAALQKGLTDQDTGIWRLGRVDSVSSDRATIDAGLEEPVELSLADNDWAEPAKTPRHYKRPVTLDSFETILTPDDIVWLRRGPDGWRLAQSHDFEVAYTALNSQTGEVVASIGAFDPGMSAFDRADLGCRQPGSVFKPLVYAEAFHKGVTPATMLSDGPVEVATGRGGVWRPRNADRDFKGYVTAGNALIWSRNIPTIHVMEHVGIASIVARAKRLGIESRIDTTSSASLGASCVRPIELAGAYLAFQRNGRLARPFRVATIRDAGGTILADHAHFAVADPDLLARVARMGQTLEWPKIGASENVSFIILDLLRKVVTSGTAHDLPDDWVVAGKTGTTNDFDAWFVGLDGDWTHVVWVGSDENERPLGRGEHGATVAMPAFQSFWEPWARTAEGEVTWPGEPPPGIEYVAIDPSTGLRAPPNEWGLMYPFVKGTAPLEIAPSKGTKQAQRAEELLYDF